MKKTFTFAILALAVATAWAQKYALYELAQSGSLSDVQAAIKVGAKVNDVGGLANLTILTYATKNKDPRVLSAILNAGADPNWRGVSGKPLTMTPIEGAAERPTPDCLNLLLAAGAKIDFADDGGFTGLEHAAANPNPEIAAVFFKNGMRASSRMRQGLFAPIQPLCFAVAYNKNAKVIQLFLENGGDPTTFGCIGDPLGTPLDFALEVHQSAEVFALLIGHGAELRSSQETSVGTLPPQLFALAKTDRADIVSLYAKAGADPNAKLAPSMETPLMMAASYSREPKMISALVAAGAKVNETDVDGNSALMYAAAQTKEPMIIDALLAAGADPNIKNKNNKSAYDVAQSNEAMAGTPQLASLSVKGAVSLIDLAKAGSAEAVRAAIKAGSLVKDRDPNGQTPLTVAAQNNPDAGVVSALLAAGADPNEVNGMGRSPLMLAAESNPNPAVIAALLKSGADPKLRTPDMFKLSALMIVANSASDPAIVAALVAGGSEIDAVDSLGRSALIIAADVGTSPPVLGALLKAGANTKLADMMRRTAFDCAKTNAAYKGSPELAALAAASK